MKIRLTLTLISFLFVSSLRGVDTIPVATVMAPDIFSLNDSARTNSDSLKLLPAKTDSLIIKNIELTSDTLYIEPEQVSVKRRKVKKNAIDTAFYRTIWKRHEPVMLDWMVYKRNPLFSELVYSGKSIEISRPSPDFNLLYFGEEPRKLFFPLDMLTVDHPMNMLRDLRNDAKDYITKHDFSLYKTTAEDLPVLEWNRYEFIEGANSEFFIEVSRPELVSTIDKNIIKGKEFSLWTAKLYTSLQFSQFAVSKNWHKGGNNYLAIVGEVRGNLDYDNRKKIKWENSLLWRTGINTVEDTIRSVMPNEDILRMISKFGLKAAGNFYYTAKAEFQTQFFDNPKAVDSYELKARLFTPVIVDLGIGMDFKYKELSVNLSPVSFKYIYLSDTVPTAKGEYLDPNAFGIEKGHNRRKDWGSELNVILKDYHPFPELKLNSNFRFFTNYKSVTIDWEIIAELQINRFLSTRLLLNPRYDTSVIMEDGKKHQMQMKEMLTVGLSFRLY